MHQDNLNNINFGIIISENVGVSNVIKGANRVNPFNVINIINIINYTLTIY